MNRTVAVCDILGFRELVRSTDLQRLLNVDLKGFRELLGFSVTRGTFQDGPPTYRQIRDQERVGFAWFSDTVLLYSLTDDDLATRNVIETVGWLIGIAISTRTKVRAGIAYGEFFADERNEIFVGPALVEAYELEQAQTWSGGAIADSLADRLPERTTTGSRFQWWLAPYSVPTKKGSRKPLNNFAIDWTQVEHDPMPFKWSPTSDEPTPSDWEANAEVCKKWLNTRKFHEDVCIACFPNNKGKDPLKEI